MENGVQIFFNKLKVFNQKGLPDLMVLNDKLMTLPDYTQNLMAIGKDNTKFVGIKGIIIQKSFLHALEFDFYIQREIK